jgi:pentatricopeptide repeat protein
MGVKAIEIFRQIPLKFINEITYICVLNACSHSGLVEEAHSIFKNISNKTEKIYTTMVYSTSSCFLKLK